MRLKPRCGYMFCDDPGVTRVIFQDRSVGTYCRAHLRRVKRLAQTATKPAFLIAQEIKL